MNPYFEVVRQLQNGIRWQQLLLAQSRLSLLTVRLALRQGESMRTGLTEAQRLLAPKSNKRRRRR